ncbi:MAG TPA: phage holin family protein [Longimicrobiales bacterium]|nr:phage holin family protein [Longimicrobiales bacterium]
MAVERRFGAMDRAAEREWRVTPRRAAEEPPIGELVKGLAEDAGELVRQEIALAKIEMRETVSSMAKDGRSVAVGGAVALLGGLALTAFLIVLLGDAVFGDNYWLSSLIVGVILLGVGWMMANRGMKDMKAHSLKPEETLRTLEEDKRWMAQERERFKRELTA